MQDENLLFHFVLLLSKLCENVSLGGCMLGGQEIALHSSTFGQGERLDTRDFFVLLDGGCERSNTALSVRARRDSLVAPSTTPALQRPQPLPRS